MDTKASSSDNHVGTSEKNSQKGRASVDELSVVPSSQPVYRVYKRRWAGLFALVSLNLIAALGQPWFGPISNEVAAEFDLSLGQVNWLGNVVSLIFLPAALIVPFLVQRWGLKYTCFIATFFMVASGWVRYAGTVSGVSGKGAYALLMVAQAFIAISQPLFQVIGPMFSQTWFDLNGRTTSTMLIAVSNPVGGAVAQFISPTFPTVRHSILVLAIISTAVAPLCLLIGAQPAIPPTHAGSKDPAGFISLIKALLGKHPKNETDEPDHYMAPRERLDFLIMFTTFGLCVGQANAFALLTGEIFVPYGYSPEICGVLGSTFLLVGLLTALVTSPIFDRYLTNHLGKVSRVFPPIQGILWLSLIWAVKPDNLAANFVVMVLLGLCSVPMLPVALELATEVTRNPEGSSALLWFNANLISFIFVLIETALTDGPDATPVPYSMHRALIFSGVFVCVGTCFNFFLQGKQSRRHSDERRMSQLPPPPENAA